jgi:hypothetical protein
MPRRFHQSLKKCREGFVVEKPCFQRTLSAIMFHKIYYLVITYSILPMRGDLASPFSLRKRRSVVTPS